MIKTSIRSSIHIFILITFLSISRSATNSFHFRTFADTCLLFPCLFPLGLTGWYWARERIKFPPPGSWAEEGRDLCFREEDFTEPDFLFSFAKSTTFNIPGDGGRRRSFTSLLSPCALAINDKHLSKLVNLRSFLLRSFVPSCPLVRGFIQVDLRTSARERPVPFGI